jgi:hypothetical protein
LGHRESNAKWYTKNRGYSLSKSRTWRKDRPKENAETQRLWALGIKVKVFTHYGPNKEVRCSWEGCMVTDLDMLSLDHINNDGAQQRKSGFPSGKNLYRKLMNDGYPAGFQTMCMNHQHKKLQLKHRGEI